MENQTAIAIPGYKVVAVVYESLRSLVCRARRERDERPVILKILKQDYPTPAEITRYKQEYEILRSLSVEGVVKAYSLHNYHNTLAICLEDFGGESLKIVTLSRKLTLSEFLAIAVKITDSLGSLHAANIIHKDINPSNIIYNSETGQVKLVDFGISSVLSRENPTLKHPNVLEGTLAYMSPEQTGRMNRSLDYRTDFYSLGVTFYELLTHQLPFEATDAMEWVHCHIAKQPVPLFQLCKGEEGEMREIPAAISDIVMKLMAKTAEERYQSDRGLKADLEECLAQLQQTGKIEPFPLGSKDISDKFQIPQKLYGREREIEGLLTAFERASSGKTELTLVSGYSGIGKSALVGVLYKPLTKAGYFAAGKFDQFKRNIPYSGLVDAFSQLVRFLLTESDERLNTWREKILAALGVNGQIVIDVIPEVELIIGPQPAVRNLGAAESQNRFNLVFQKFIRVFCSKEHPLVIFLDDLQWADSATLNLIQLIMTDEETKYLFLIGAYRDNEVNPMHPFIMTLNTLRERGTIINQISLTALSVEAIAQMISETVRKDKSDVKPLAKLVTRKTGGNPFFVNQFLKTLYQENLLAIAPDSGEWQWDIAEIEARDITDNVVEFTISKLRKLPDTTQLILRLAACMGNKFDLQILSIISEKSAAKTFAHLLPAIREELILPTSELENIDKISRDFPLLIRYYKFLHDRVQQAAYEPMDAEEKKAIHLKIGRLLLAHTSERERSEKIFEIVDRLNEGRELISDERERIELAYLNCQAAQKAKEATAYAAAREYLIVGMETLDESCWRDRYDFAFKIYKLRAETEYLTGNLEASEVFIEEILHRAKSAIEKAEIYILRIVQYTLLAKYEEAIKAGRQALRLLGINLPEEGWKTALAAEFAEVKENLRDREISAIVDEPEIINLQKKVAIKILISLDPPTYFVNWDLYALASLKAVNLSLKYGNDFDSIKSYCNYGVIISSILGEYKTACEFGLMALKLSEKFQNSAQKCKACLIVASWLNCWVKPLKSNQPLYDEGYRAGLESGELQFSGYLLAFKLLNSYFRGGNLQEILAESPNCFNFSIKTKNYWVSKAFIGLQITILQLLENPPKDLEMRSLELDEERYLKSCYSHQALGWICNFYILKSQILYLYDRETEAIACAVEAEKLINFLQGTFSVAEGNFYYSLILAALYPNASKERQNQYWEKLEAHQKQMKIWAENCPENFLHKYLLVAAEMARISGNGEAAMDLYDRAIASALENEFIQNEALANELAAKFWLARGKEKFAKLYLREARYAYQRWGAHRKVEYLEEKYPHLLARNKDSLTLDSRLTPTNITTDDTLVSRLDLVTVMKASQALSAEIVLEEFLIKLMKIALENAGAETGCLMLMSGENLLIEAAGGTEQLEVCQALPVENSDRLPISVINYVARTRENVVLKHAASALNFASDPYIQLHAPKSVLCAPIVDRGQLIGILYLENNLTVDAFTRDRIELLQLLCSQAAISLENARLYQVLQESEAREREKAIQLEQSLRELASAHLQLVQSEKMSALGELVAGVAHEINNPVNFIAGNISYAQQYIQDIFDHLQLYEQHFSVPVKEISDHATEIELEYLKEDLPHLIGSMKEGTDRIRQISASLRTFSRSDTFEKVAFNIHDGINSTLMILKHRLSANKNRPAIEIVKNYAELPPVSCYPGQLNQVFMNILGNAIDALDEYSQEFSYECVKTRVNTIAIQTEIAADARSVIIRIKDNGPGMSAKVMERIFDQLFTTKPVGKGTGLGLSISKQIVEEKHGGKLTCNSEIGKGTEFAIALPIEPLN